MRLKPFRDEEMSHRFIRINYIDLVEDQHLGLVTEAETFEHRANGGDAPLEVGRRTVDHVKAVDGISLVVREGETTAVEVTLG